MELLRSILMTIVLVSILTGGILFGILYRGKTYIFKSDDIVEDNKKDMIKSFVNIAYYILVMFIIVSLISTVIVLIWLSKNGYSYDMVNQNSELFDEAVYNRLETELNPLLQLIMYLLAIVVILILSLKWMIDDMKAFKPMTLAWGVIGICFVYAGSITANVILMLLGASDTASNQQAIESMVNSGTGALIIMLFTTIILAPVLEELVFRKSFFNLFKKRPVLGLVISSISFGLIHVIGPSYQAFVGIINGTSTYYSLMKEMIQLIPYTLMGAGLGMTYLCSRKNIWASIIAHTSINSISMIIVLFAN